jgi:hypothetical protein
VAIQLDSYAASLLAMTVQIVAAEITRQANAFYRAFRLLTSAATFNG